jgi:hypothetical protein
MPPIVTSAEIERPAAEVFAYATDPTRFSEWQQGVVDGHMDGPANGSQSPAVGAKCVTTRRIGGANRPSTSELVHIDLESDQVAWRANSICTKPSSSGQNWPPGLISDRASAPAFSRRYQSRRIRALPCQSPGC